MTMLFDVVKTRTSVRRYLDKAIPAEDIDACVEAARLAPSACNAQPWKFIIVDDPTVKRRLCDAAFSGVYAMNGFVKTAPVVVAVVSERQKFLSMVGSYLRNTRYYLIDIGIAGEHLILQAAALGIGSCWIGWFNERAVQKVLHIPRNKKVDVLIALGYPEPGNQRQRERLSMNAVSSRNRYTSRGAA